MNYAAIWSFALYENSTDLQAAATLPVWLLDVYTDVATSCICAPLHVVKYMGGWAKNIAVAEGKYIVDPTMTPFLAAWHYLGWLVPSRPHH
jgi:hypothetical protein